MKDRYAAVCTWMVRVKVADVRGTGGTVPGRQLLDILARIKPPTCRQMPRSPSDAPFRTLLGDAAAGARRRKLAKPDLPRLTDDEVFEYVKRTYVRAR